MIVLWRVAAGVLLPLVPTLAVFGNFLVILAVFQDRVLQTVTNMLIVSLAVSDLMVALFVMSFGVYYEWNGFKWQIGHFLCHLYLACDVICSTASILNLLAISLDRYMAISHPISYAQVGTNNRRAVTSLCIVWGVSIAVGTPLLFGVNPMENEQCELGNPWFNAVSSVFSFFIPSTTMICLYTVVFKRLRARERARTMRHASSNKHNENISSALLGGASFARQMGKHFKNRADQILLENSFQTSSFPTVSESSDDISSMTPMPTELNFGPTTAIQKKMIVESESLPVMAMMNGNLKNKLSPRKNSLEDACKEEKPAITSDDALTSYWKKEEHKECPLRGYERQMHLPRCICIKGHTVCGDPIERAIELVEATGGCPICGEGETTERSSRTEHFKEGRRYSSRSFGDDLEELFPFIDSAVPSSEKSSKEDLCIKRPEERVFFNSVPAINHHQGRRISQSMRLIEPRRVIQKHLFSDGFRNGSIKRKVTDVFSLPPRSSLLHVHTMDDVAKIHKPVPPTKTKSFVDFLNADDCTFSDSVRICKDQLWNRVTGWKTRPSRQMMKKASKQMRREHKATVTLAVVLAVFLFCWLPFFILHLFNSVCSITKNEPQGCLGMLPMFLATWLGYVNSSLNPLIYTIFDQRFRRAFRNVLSCGMVKK